MKTILGIFAIILLVAVAPAATADSTEEFHQTYSLNANGRVSLSNINGDVDIVAWDRNEVQVDAVKRADSQDKLEDIKILVDADANSIDIETDYDQDHKWNRNNPGEVIYSLKVPRTAELGEISLVNGDLNVDGVQGDVEAACVNGELSVNGLMGEATLSTVNGPLEATFDRLGGSQRISLSSVNGSIRLMIPENSDADVTATTVSGRINSEYGFPVDRSGWVGQNLSGTLGKGSARVTLSNVNGRIEIQKPGQKATQKSGAKLGVEDRPESTSLYDEVSETLGATVRALSKLF